MPRAFKHGALLGPKRDRRRREIREALARAIQIIDDAGGESDFSLIERDRVERYVFVSHYTRQLEATARGGNKIDEGRYLALLNAELRLGELIGAKRRPKTVPSLQQYLAQKAESSTPGTGAVSGLSTHLAAAGPNPRGGRSEA